MMFRQNQKEPYFKCWEQFNKLILPCPHLGYEAYRLIKIFIENLTPETRQFIEMMCNGQFDQKTPDEAWEFLELMAKNAQKWASSEGVDHSRGLNQYSKGGGIYQVNNQIDIQAKLTTLMREVEALSFGKNKDTVMVCGICAFINYVIRLSNWTCLTRSN